MEEQKMMFLMKDVLAHALGEWAENVTVGSVKQVMKTVDRPKESTASGTPLGPIKEV